MIKRTFSAYFEYQGYGRPDQIKKDYSWWSRVMVRAVKRSNAFRFECAKGDIEGLSVCAKLGARGFATVEVEGTNEIWTGDLSAEVIRNFLDDPFAVDGGLKWSSVILKSGEKTILACTKKGRQIGMYGVFENDLEFFAGAVHGANFSFYYWEEVPSGTSVSLQPIYSFDGDLNDIIEAYDKGSKKVR